MCLCLTWMQAWKVSSPMMKIMNVRRLSSGVVCCLQTNTIYKCACKQLPFTNVPANNYHLQMCLQTITIYKCACGSQDFGSVKPRPTQVVPSSALAQTSEGACDHVAFLHPVQLRGRTPFLSCLGLGASWHMLFTALYWQCIAYVYRYLIPALPGTSQKHIACLDCANSSEW